MVVLSSTEILISINNELFSWTLGYENLSWDQLVSVENELRFALESVKRARSKQEGSPVNKGKNKRKKKPIQQSLNSTADAIRRSGSILANWLNSGKHPWLQSQLQSTLSKFPKAIVEDGVKLKPMSGREWNHSRKETMLWLVYKHASLAHALLVLCALPTKDLDLYTLEETTSIVEYVIQNRDMLSCEALEREAGKLIQMSGNTGNRDDLHEHVAGRSSSSHGTGPADKSSVDRVDEENEHQEIGTQQVVRKRKRGISFPESGDGSDSSSYEEVMKTSLDSPFGPTPIPFALPGLSSDSVELLSLIVSLGGHEIPELLFLRFRAEQKRWTSHGEIGIFSPSAAGFDPVLQRILSPSRFTALINELSSCVRQDKSRGTANDVYYTVISCLKGQFPNHIDNDHRRKILAIKLICFVFPRERLWEPRFLSDVKTLIPCLKYTLAQVRDLELPVDIKEEALQCILVKAGLEAGCCQEELAMAQRLLEDDNRLPQYLGAAIAHRRSALARLNGDYTASCTFIDNHLSNSTWTHHVDRRLHAWHLHLFASRLKVFNLMEKFDDAYRMIVSWRMPEATSLMELRVHIDLSLVVSDIQKSLGQLELSKSYLEDCYRHPGLLCNDPKQYQIICALVDVRCALGEIDEAESLVKAETEKLRSTDGLSKARRRLLVSSLDVNIARISQPSLAEARSKISDLTRFFNESPSLDISDQLLHVRTLTASARIYHMQSSFEQAIAEWEKVKTLAQQYSAFREKGFTFAFSELSIGYAQLQIALRSIGHADSIFKGEKDNYWIPTIATNWLPEVRSDITACIQSR
ncbi:hypothetical protein N7539_008652 [Penicillium diatomitis]|uniref:Uncharacterized protein n=1 Tax=Penicillium diatomitis TaxID=2819901 RepID=A0A9W9WRN7_9EURO|nr:uncharacterized protein N7539_008652 [Penicillium diatomitis]KAJ5472083.1 hypothetical protein N7539_008652 [Penicillium diatomitis]